MRTERTPRAADISRVRDCLTEMYGHLAPGGEEELVLGRLARFDTPLALGIVQIAADLEALDEIVDDDWQVIALRAYTGRSRQSGFPLEDADRAWDRMEGVLRRQGYGSNLVRVRFSTADAEKIFAPYKTCPGR